jgi:adenine-specific DNA-methyltransferase
MSATFSRGRWKPPSVSIVRRATRPLSDISNSAGRRVVARSSYAGDLGPTLVASHLPGLPFLAAAAGLLKAGGRLAFVVPSEIGHAPYAAPLLDYLVKRFALVQIVAIRKKLFPELSEDCWLLYADGFGGTTDHIRFTVQESFAPSASPPRRFLRVNVADWRAIWKRRLRPFLMQPDARDLYCEIAGRRQTRRFGELASVGIGYVSGANDFFHLRPSEAEKFDIVGSATMIRYCF